MAWHINIQSMIPVGQIGDTMMIFYHDAAGNYFRVKPLELEKIDMSGSFELSDATMKSKSGHFGSDLNPEFADFLQSIVDAAWRYGIRPRGLPDHSNELKAVREHLADMRKLAKIDEPSSAVSPQPFGEKNEIGIG